MNNSKNKVLKVKKISKKSLIRKADKLFSLKVREVGVCQLQGKDKVNCGGGLQCAHIVGRGRHVIRWNRLNALCICAGHHVYYTHHPVEWEALIMNLWPSVWKHLLEEKEKPWDKNIESVLSRLTTGG